MKLRIVTVFLLVLSAMGLMLSACNNKLDLPTNALVGPTATPCVSCPPCLIPGPRFVRTTGSGPVSIFGLAINNQAGYVVAAANGAVTGLVAFDLNLNFNGILNLPGFVTGVAISPKTGNIYATSLSSPSFYASTTIYAFTANGDFINSWGGSSVMGGVDIKVLPNDNVLVSANNGITGLAYVFSPEGNPIATIGTGGVYCTGLAVGPNSHIYGFSTGSLDLVEADQSGNILRHFADGGMPSICNTIQTSISGMAFVGTTLYVSDPSRGVVSEFTESGEFIGLFGGPSFFANPTGIAVGKDGTIYIADSANGSISAYRN